MGKVKSSLRSNVAKSHLCKISSSLMERILISGNEIDSSLLLRQEFFLKRTYYMDQKIRRVYFS